MKLTNLETYYFIMEHMDEASQEELCSNYSSTRISISVLKYLRQQQRILQKCTGKKSISFLADEEGISPGKIYRAIKRKIAGNK